MSNDKLISEYRAAIRAMYEGRFDLSIQTDGSSEIGKLGSDLKDLAHQFKRKLDEVNKMQEISEEISAGLFLDDVMNRVYENFHSIIPYNRMSCALLSNENQLLTAYWVRSDAPSVMLKLGYSAPMEGSGLQAILETGRPRILNDLETYLAEHPDSAATKLLMAEGMRSSLTCPLVAQGKSVGFLFFTSMEKNTYQDIHQDVFLRIAGQLSILIEKSRLSQQVYELNQKLLLAQESLEHEATHDALTDIFNRSAIYELLERRIARIRRHIQPLSVIMLDIDNFKKVNDTYGHLVGDAVLRTVASKMKECLRDYDYIGRYGGEEFLIVLDDADYEMAAKTTERIRHAVSDKPVTSNGKQLVVTISAGVVVAENNANLTPDRIITAADEALYKAKENGRNRFEIRRI